jgi:hypothetical protein
MTEATASTVVDFKGIDGLGLLSAVVDPIRPGLGAFYNYPYIPHPSTFEGTQITTLTRELVQYGYAYVRVYCSSLVTPTITPLFDLTIPELPTDERWKLWYAGVNGSAASRPPENGYVGTPSLFERRTQDYRDTYELVTFVDSQFNRLQYGYDEPDHEVLTTSTFYDERGEVAPAPVEVAPGVWSSPIRVTGAISVRYKPYFNLYRVFYHLDDDYIDITYEPLYTAADIRAELRSGNLRELSLEGLNRSQVTMTERPSIAFPILVSTPRGNAQLDIERKTAGLTMPGGSIDAEGGNDIEDYTEVAASKTTVRVEDPNDSTSYIDFERYNEITMRDESTGKVFSLAFRND